MRFYFVCSLNQSGQLFTPPLRGAIKVPVCPLHVKPLINCARWCRLASVAARNWCRWRVSACELGPGSLPRQLPNSKALALAVPTLSQAEHIVLMPRVYCMPVWQLDLVCIFDSLKMARFSCMVSLILCCAPYTAPPNLVFVLPVPCSTSQQYF